MTIRSSLRGLSARSFVTVAAVAASMLAGCGAPAAEDTLATNVQGVTVNMAPGESLADAIRRASPGDRVMVPAGVYAGGGWIERSGTESAPITIVSADGPRRAVIEGGSESLRVGNSSWLVFDGFEVRNSGNNAVHIDNSHHITLRNMYAHDAGREGDVVKVNQSHHMTIELSEFARPGARSGGENPYQECLDFVDVDDSTIRDNFIHDGGSMLMFVKGGSRNTVIERNVFSQQRAGASDPMVGLGGPTDPELLQGEQYEIINVIFRNNVVMNGVEGAVAVYDAQGAYIANNLLLDNDRSLVEFRAGEGPAARSENVQVVNNAMVDTRGRMPTPYRVLSHGLTGFSTSHNTFWNGGAALPGCELVNLAAQAGHAVSNPMVTPPSPNADRATILAAVRPATGSSLAGTGADTTTMPFGVLVDIHNVARSAARDRGPFVLAPSTAPVAPVVETVLETVTSTVTDVLPVGGAAPVAAAPAAPAGGSCPAAEPVAMGDSGHMVNADGRIRDCFPGEALCFCDADNDCYAEEGYVACR